MAEHRHSPVFRPGESCWRAVRAERASFLVDGRRYFSALGSAIRRARKQLLVAGWDLHTEAALTRDAGATVSSLSDVLESALRAHPELRVHLLVWRASWPLRFGRQWFTGLRLRSRFGERVTYRSVPGRLAGQSHHQKIVVVDDAVAFAGGIDLTAQRWDDCRHLVQWEQRRDPWGDAYEPWHDVQLMVSGEAAQALGDLVRERWQRANGEVLPRCAESPFWPDEAEPDLEDVPVAIARTVCDGDESIREIEALYAGAVSRARKWIYLENQYFACESLARRLEERLDEPDGPEVILISPAATDTWLDWAVMGSKRAYLLDRLQRHPNSHRLGIYEPVRGGEDAHPLFVHAKVALADLDYAQVGSANLANRSFRLDTECDLGVASGEARRRNAPPLVYRLLAEHLDAEVAEVEGIAASSGSLLETIEKLRGRERTLEPFRVSSEDAPLDRKLAESLDPERPQHPYRVLASLLRSRPRLRRSLLAAATLLLAGLALLIAAVFWIAV